ncbi:MAG TPA: tetratricopeptide repeat protein [Thermoanaerobaculia bacterium]
MAQPATNPKIEELRFRLKTDPRSRLFYQLAEELRKAGHFGEAEQVLRSGLNVYPAYLAAWVSLGRVLREQKNDTGAVEALSKAMQLDPGNVVAARLLADAYLNLGDRVEAIKKYKLVHALMPGDEELKHTIERLDREIAPEPEPVPVPEPEPVILSREDGEGSPSGGAASVPAAGSFAVFAAQEDIPESPFDKTTPPFAEALATGDAEPMLAAHDESPFEEPVDGATVAAFSIEQPSGMHIAAAPLSAELPGPPPSLEDEADVFAPVITEPAPAEALTDTLTMAELYERQGLVHEAQHIYENILARDPENSDVRAKLEAVAPRVNPKIERLERWLAKVARREAGRV